MPIHTLKGNLPLGYGLAGSTVLTFLHLSHLKDIISRDTIINDIDKEIHGFMPSGLDFESCIHQEWGLFCNKLGWQSISPSIVNYFLIIFPKERKNNLSKIQERILSARKKLCPIQKELNIIVKSHNIINLDLLMEYSQILSSIGVYSEKANEFINDIMKQGYIAKGIGGLYDKAVIVMYDRNKKKHFEMENLVLSISGKVVSNSQHSL